MPALSRQSPPFHLGAWRVDPASGFVAQGTEVRRARALVMDLLLVLAARPGEVVSKDELIAGVWGGASVADSALTSTIAELRELLGDQSRSPRYIETLPKRGYRLIAPVAHSQDVPRSEVLSPEPQPPQVPQSEVLPCGAADSVARDRAMARAAQPRAAAVPGRGIAVGDGAAAAAAASATGAAAPAAETAAADTSDRSSWLLRRRVAFALGAIFAVAAIVSIASITSNSRRHPAASSTSASAGAAASGASGATIMRLTLDLPADARLAPDSVPRLALTADGTRMAYVARTEAGAALYTRTLDQFVAQPIAGTSGALAPFFSPDGSRVGFFANGELRTVPISGGAATIVCPARIPLGASWGPDGTIVFSGTHGRGLSDAPAAGGPSRELTTIDFPRGELSHRWPQVLPDGDRVLFTSVGITRADAMIVSRRTGKPRVVLEQAQAAMFVPPNRLLFERGGRLHAATIDPASFELTETGGSSGLNGSSRVLVEDLASRGQGYGPPAFAAAGGGVLVYVPVDPHDEERDLVWVDRSGNVAPLDAPPRSYMHPRVSRDGQQVMTWLRTRDPGLWIFDIASRAMTRVTTGVPSFRAAWSPDGRQVMFDGPSADNPVTLYWASLDGGETRRLRPEKRSIYAGAWAPDGRTLAYVDLSRTTGFDIITVDATVPSAQAVPSAPAAPSVPSAATLASAPAMAPTRRGPADATVPSATPSVPSISALSSALAMTPALRGPANETAPAFSPDGRWLAFVSDVSGREEVYVMPIASPEATATAMPGAASPKPAPVQVSTQGGREPVWSRRGDELFFRQGQSMLAVRVTGTGTGTATGAATRTSQPRISDPVTLFSGDFDRRPSFQPSYDVAPDGRFLMIRGRAPSTTDARIAVLLRWDRP